MYVYRLQFEDFYVDMSSRRYIGKEEFKLMVRDFCQSWKLGEQPKEFAKSFKQKFAFDTVNIIKTVKVRFTE